jgi:hypothetical protein
MAASLPVSSVPFPAPTRACGGCGWRGRAGSSGAGERTTTSFSASLLRERASGSIRAAAGAQLPPCCTKGTEIVLETRLFCSTRVSSLLPHIQAFCRWETGYCWSQSKAATAAAQCDVDGTTTCLACMRRRHKRCGRDAAAMAAQQWLRRGYVYDNSSGVLPLPL